MKWDQIGQVGHGISTTLSKSYVLTHLQQGGLRPWVAHLKMTVYKVRGKHCPSQNPTISLNGKSKNIYMTLNDLH